MRDPSQSYRASPAIWDHTGERAPHQPQSDRLVLSLPTRHRGINYF